MKFSATLTMWLGIVFAAVCFAVALQGFTSLDGITDPAQRADSIGFAWFWTFLGAIGVALVLVNHWLTRPRQGSDDR